MVRIEPSLLAKGQVAATELLTFGVAGIAHPAGQPVAIASINRLALRARMLQGYGAGPDELFESSG